MKPLTKKDMYAIDNNGKTICILPTYRPKKHRKINKYNPSEEDKKHRG